MIVVDELKCVGCARCFVFCPQGAIKVFGYAQVDTSKCTDCFGGVYHFEESDPIIDKKQLLDRTKSYWTYPCVENCPNEALIVREEQK